MPRVVRIWCCSRSNQLRKKYPAHACPSEKPLLLLYICRSAISKRSNSWHPICLAEEDSAWRRFVISRLLTKGTADSVSKAWLIYSEPVGDFSDGRTSGRCLTSQALSITLEMRLPDI